MKRETLSGLEQERTEPAVLARSFVTQKLNPYNKDDPRYQPTPQEQIERYQKLTLDDVKSLYRDYIGASNGELAVVGDFDNDELLAGLGKIVGDFKSPKPYERLKWQSVDPVKTDETINTPDKANGVYFAILPVPMNDANGDYPALMMASDVLGGSAGSRLWARLREKEGFSYGTGSHLTARSLDASGTFMEFAAFNPQNGAKLKAAAREELRKMLSDGIKPAELETARSDFLRGRMMSRSEDGRLADLLTGQLYAGRTMHYEADLEDKVKALTPDEILAAAKKYIDPDKLTIVEAGDFEKGNTAKH
jgi:zinc protease